MPQLQRPIIPERKTVVKLKAKGINTKAIQKAIDEMAAQGGGVVVIPAEEWQTGRIEVKSNINLHLTEGATLNFSGFIRIVHLLCIVRFDVASVLLGLAVIVDAHKQQIVGILRHFCWVLFALNL